MQRGRSIPLPGHFDMGLNGLRLLAGGWDDSTCQGPAAVMSSSALTAAYSPSVSLATRHPFKPVVFVGVARRRSLPSAPTCCAACWPSQHRLKLRQV